MKASPLDGLTKDARKSRIAPMPIQQNQPTYPPAAPIAGSADGGGGAGFIEAIPTSYQGIKFRSRIEARWAIFYDLLKIPWEYEKEGYDLGNNLYYLPDFWLPQQDCWVEIKGKYPNKTEEQKAVRLSHQTGKRVFIFFGPIPRIENFFARFNWGSAYLYDYNSKEILDCNYLWCGCSFCGEYGIEYEGRSARIPCQNSCLKTRDDKGHNYDAPFIMQAYRIARARRFFQ